MASITLCTFSMQNSSLIKGLLSNAVCWDVLEEQLFYSRIGRDERRRELFQYITERHHSEEHFKIISGEQCSGEINNLTKVSNRKRRRKYTPQQETVSTLRTILDAATHLATYPPPLVPQLAVFVAAKDDVYVPRQNVTDVRSVWPGEKPVLRGLRSVVRCTWSYDIMCTK